MCIRDSTREDLEEKITDRTKILVLPFPNNPTGSIMTKEDLAPIAEVAVEHDLFVISDEIYSELTYGTDHVSIASFPGMRAVSYTHLDVYKRQVQNQACGSRMYEPESGLCRIYFQSFTGASV